MMNFGLDTAGVVVPLDVADGDVENKAQPETLDLEAIKEAMDAVVTVVPEPQATEEELEVFVDAPLGSFAAEPQVTEEELELFVDAMRDPRSSTRAVATASALQVREGVVRRDQPKWAPYAHRLQPLADALARGGVAGS